MSGRLPTAVLSQSLADAVGGRRVRAAVFTTYCFDPGFFELNVLPLLFDQSFSQADKLRLIQLEDALREVDHLAVYYDRCALSQDAEPARLDYRRIDVRRHTGVFHPKLVLLLVEARPEPDGDDEGEPPAQSLIVAALSANLTRAGWWENVECGHLEEVAEDRDGSGRLPFRGDLLAMLRRVRRTAGPGEDHGALDAIHAFVREQAPRAEYAHASHGGRYHTRLFGGRSREDFAAWLAGIAPADWNLEVVSPYFDAAEAAPLAALMEALSPRETRVYLPADADGSALVTEAAWRAVEELGASWAALPAEIVTRGRSERGDRLAPRRVHAKLYRVWRRGKGQCVVVGSVNLTSAAHGHGGAGNLEAAFLVDAGGERPEWWLQPLEVEAERFAERVPGEDEELAPAPVDLSLRFDWAAERLEYRIEGEAGGALRVTDISGQALFSIDAPEAGGWIDCGAAAAAALRDHLRSSSFVRVKHQRGEWRVLVREEGGAHRPSLLADLTPEEILEYWSLLTPEQRAAFLEAHAGLGLDLEGLPVRMRQRLGGGSTLFDRFAGVYHAFGCLRRHVEAALGEGRVREAEARLFGARYDSLPLLLEKSLAREDLDPVIRYVTFLSAAQLAREIRRGHPDFYSGCGPGVQRLEALLARLPEVRAGLPLEDGDFLEWYERAFLRDLSGTAADDAHDHA